MTKRRRFININGEIQNDPRRTKAYFKIRKELLKEIGKCEECGYTKKLEIHHIDKVSRFPEKALDRDNMQVLCHKCHTRKHKKEHNDNRIYRLLENKDKIKNWSLIKLTEKEKVILTENGVNYG